MYINTIQIYKEECCFGSLYIKGLELLTGLIERHTIIRF